MIDKNSCIEPTAYKWKYIDSTVCLENASGKFVLNDIGSKIWRYFDGYTSFETIIDKIMESEGEDNREEVEQLVTEFIEQLEKEKFIMIHEVNSEEEW